MATTRKSRSRFYIYAIIEADQARPLGKVGLKGAAVNCIVEQGLAAVVSKTEETRVRPQRANIVVHNGVVKQLTDAGVACLPLAFGTISANEGAVRALLREEHDTLLEQVRFFHDKVEMGLRVKFDVSNIYQYIMDSHPELRHLRDQVFGAQHDPGRDAKVELGRVFDRLLNEDRQTYRDKVQPALEAVSEEVRVNDPRNDHEVINLACLVRRDRVKEFEDTVVKAAGQFGNEVAFNYSGPWAPFNFIDVRFDAERLHAHSG
ncbi:GvpL/GvpF family gas vesicle protein [Ectothiorhodospira variabilis]|uniref:GvpL/GvpF family gas vesicle protein n=1 Tax=Ectothiorhodospira variabilis TaxID=505694 RepID=UPI001EFC053C|nr:GvpL/GvpF family gas vesicle protein [Ectothiorhodospira variabilis]MCG5495769.1 GvpL/GvpF family gas vesicle protein [Ectothiorhodospira variabilis]MCG5498554.1 GvpL/GvpF family gas vesicle protein [Ectothiorhodospira variabilis]MCG5505204.1 GvpL/GvpF family gas vesicle protein [Ectothiorhodospira variabilis]MCG5508359.1 GvpL/GvpF family gas vesicle protein [Ectothiorhodospira variabilis]